MRISRLVVGSVSTNCYIVSNEETKEAFIIDPGEEASRIERKLLDEKLDLKAILLTHGHFDHIMAVNDLLEKYKADVYIGENELELLGDTYKNCSGSMMNRPYTAKADKALRDDDVLELAGMTIKVLFTPGHTSGGVCYYLEKEEVLFSGDTVFCQSVGRSDLPTGSGRVLQESIQNKILPLPENTRIFPGHGDSTTVAYEKKYNPYF